MSRPDDYGIVAELIRQLGDASTYSHGLRVKALAALEGLAGTEHAFVVESEESCMCFCYAKLDGDCAVLRRECLAKVKGER
jgi:hypothetical protein